MKKTGIFAAAATAAMLLGIAAATAGDAAKGGSDKVIFENDRVRVIEVNYPPGSTHDMHSHPDHVVYALGDSKVRFTGKDGKSADAEIKAGSVRWTPAVSHKTENVGTTPIRAVLVELKEPAK